METNHIRLRLQDFIENILGISVASFERKVGLSNGYVGSIKKDITPSRRKMITNAYPELNMAWVITGEGEKLNDIPKEKSDVQIIANSEEVYAPFKTLVLGENDAEKLQRAIAQCKRMHKAETALLQEKIKMLEDEIKSKEQQLQDRKEDIDRLNTANQELLKQVSQLIAAVTKTN